MEIHPIQRPFLLHGPLCSLSLSLFWTLSRLALLCSLVLLLLFSLSLSRLSSVCRSLWPLAGTSSGTPQYPEASTRVLVQYAGQLYHYAITACTMSSFYLPLCVCVGVCGSSDIVPESKLFENNDKSGIKFWILYEYYVRIYIHKLVKWVRSEFIKQAAKWLNNMNTLMWMVI